MAAGFTIEEALAYANSGYEPAYESSPNYYDYMPMWYSGDRYARLMTVYTGAETPHDPNEGRPADPIHNPKCSWYKVNP